jgi:hypothetical protein
MYNVHVKFIVQIHGVLPSIKARRVTGLLCRIAEAHLPAGDKSLDVLSLSSSPLLLMERRTFWSLLVRQTINFVSRPISVHYQLFVFQTVEGSNNPNTGDQSRYFVPLSLIHSLLCKGRHFWSARCQLVTNFFILSLYVSYLFCSEVLFLIKGIDQEIFCLPFLVWNCCQCRSTACHQHYKVSQHGDLQITDKYYIHSSPRILVLEMKLHCRIDVSKKKYALDSWALSDIDENEFWN